MHNKLYIQKQSVDDDDDDVDGIYLVYGSVFLGHTSRPNPYPRLGVRYY